MGVCFLGGGGCGVCDGVQHVCMCVCGVWYNMYVGVYVVCGTTCAEYNIPSIFTIFATPYSSPNTGHLHIGTLTRSGGSG